MKRFMTLIVCSLGVTYSLNTPVFAQTSAQLNVRANVSMNCTIQIQALPKAAALNLLAGELNTTIALVTENCNSPNGYTVHISSAAAGKLRPKSQRNYHAPYHVHYDDAQGHINLNLQTTRTTAQFNKVVPVAVSLTGDSKTLADQFEDQLQFVIQAR